MIWPRHKCKGFIHWIKRIRHASVKKIMSVMRQSFWKAVKRNCHANHKHKQWACTEIRNHWWKPYDSVSSSSCSQCNIVTAWQTSHWKSNWHSLSLQIWSPDNVIRVNWGPIWGQICSDMQHWLGALSCLWDRPLNPFKFRQVPSIALHHNFARIFGAIETTYRQQLWKAPIKVQSLAMP